MSLFKRGNVWWIAITSSDGKRVRCTSGTTDRERAQELHDRLKHESWNQKKLGAKARHTWDEAALRWLKEMKHKASIRDDARHIKAFTEALRGRYLEEIRRDDISPIIGQLVAAGTANRYVATIRAILRKAEREWGWLDRAPIFRTHKEPKRRIRWLTQQEAGTLIRAMPEHLKDPAILALATGLRQSNVFGLQWSQIDMQRKVAWVHPDQAKARRAIGVPLNQDAVEAIRRQIGRHATHVFTHMGKPLKCPESRTWKRVLKKAGIEDFRWHDLRHTWASWHIQNGTPLGALQEMGGWESSEMVRRYAHLSPSHLQPHAEGIAGIVAQIRHNVADSGDTKVA